MRLMPDRPNLRWVPTRTNRAELLDGPVDDARELRQNLADIRQANQWLGGTALTVKAVARFAVPGRSLGVLDVATGSADIPIALCRWARRRRIDLAVSAVDARLDVVREAASFVGTNTQIWLAVADGLSLPFADDAFDVAACSLVLHHLGEQDAIAFLREMRRVSRHGIVVNDLVRSWPALGGAWLWSRLFTTNRMTRHDGPLSVRRAYTSDELIDLAHRADLRVVAESTWLGTRIALTAIPA